MRSALRPATRAARLTGVEEDDPGSLHGELVVQMFDFGEQSQIRHSLRLPSGELRSLRFAEPPDLAPGSRLRVWGQAQDKTFVVTRFEPLAEPLTERALGLVNGTKKKAKRWAFVLIDLGAGVNLTAAAAKQKLFSDAPTSIRSYYREVSYGTQDLDGEVFGPIEVSDPGTADLCENFKLLPDNLQDMIPGTFDQYLWYFGSRRRPATGAASPSLGRPTGPRRTAPTTPAPSCIVLVQEPGTTSAWSTRRRCAARTPPGSRSA